MNTAYLTLYCKYAPEHFIRVNLASACRQASSYRCSALATAMKTCLYQIKHLSISFVFIKCFQCKF